jgi:excisionase family DNA binding protein
MNKEKLYKLSDVMNILGVTRVTLYNYIKAGKVKAVKVGAQWRIPQTEIDRLTEQGL